MSEPTSRKRLSDEQREEITRRVLAGENQTSLSEEFGCTRAYVSLLKMAALHPERYRKKLDGQLTRKLTDAQLERLKETIRTSNPYELGLKPPLRRWDADHVEQIAQRMFQKKPSARIIKECLSCVPAPTTDPLFRRPKPPEKHHISLLSRELAENKDFVKYYLSPAAERLAWRQYELALADWISRFGDVEVADPHDYPETPDPDEKFDIAIPPQNPPPASYGQRVGKHAKGKAKPKPARKKRKGKRR